jgi:hypothetical protein
MPIYQLQLDSDDVHNLLTCLESAAAATPSANTRLVFEGLMHRIEDQTGVRLEAHAPRDNTPEMDKRAQQRLRDKLAELAEIAPRSASAACDSHIFATIGDCVICGASR